MRSITRIAAATAAAAAVVLVSAATASANSDHIDDRRYDVMIDDGPHLTLASKGTYAQRVAASNIDVNDMSVNHGKDFVSVRVNFHKLGADTNSYIESEVRVNGGLEDDFWLYASADGAGGVVANTYPEESGSNCSSYTDTNRIKGSSKTGADGFLQLYIPRSCFNSPNHIKFGSASTFYDFNWDTASASGLKQARAQAQAEATNTYYTDPISSVLFGAPEYTSWLTRN